MTQWTKTIAWLFGLWPPARTPWDEHDGRTIEPAKDAAGLLDAIRNVLQSNDVASKKRILLTLESDLIGPQDEQEAPQKQTGQPQ